MPYYRLFVLIWIENFLQILWRIDVHIIKLLYYIKLSAVCRSFCEWLIFLHTTIFYLLHHGYYCLDWLLWSYSLNFLWFIVRFISLSHWPCLLTIHSYDIIDWFFFFFCPQTNKRSDVYLFVHSERNEYTRH